MKRFSIKDLPSKYSNAEYNLKQMTTNDLKHWKEQGCLDDEETGILMIAKDNEIDYLYIGNQCPDGADDIAVTGVKLAIYFDGDDLMVKAKNDVDIEYISNAIDEILSMYDESNNTMFCGSKETDEEDTIIRFKVGKKYFASSGSAWECIDTPKIKIDHYKGTFTTDVTVKFKSLDDNDSIVECNISLVDNVEVAKTITDKFLKGEFKADNIAVPKDFKVGTIYKGNHLKQTITKVTNCYVWIDNIRYKKAFNERTQSYDAYDNRDIYNSRCFVPIDEYNQCYKVSTETTEKIETNSNELAKSTEIEDLTREEMEYIIKKDIVKFNEFAVGKIKEYAPETQELKVYTSPTYNYRVDEIFAYSEYIQVYVAIYGISQLAHLVKSCVDYQKNEVFDYDKEEEIVFVWGGFNSEEKSETIDDTNVVTKDDETIYEEKERFVRISLKSLLFDIDKNILDVYYKYQDGEEIVTIVYFYGNSANVKINVTGDSLLAIVNDVTKRLLV